MSTQQRVKGVGKVESHIVAAGMEWLQPALADGGQALVTATTLGRPGSGLRSDTLAQTEGQRGLGLAAWLALGGGKHRQ